MKNIFNRFEKCFFPLVLILCGLIYLSLGDGAKIYNEFVLQGLSKTELLLGMGVTATANDVEPMTYDAKLMTYDAEPVANDAELMTNDAESVANDVESEINNAEPVTNNVNVEVTDKDNETVFTLNEQDEQTECPNIPTFITVEPSEFANSVFIGDSRVVGLMKYGELNEYAQFYASTGLTIHKLFQAQIALVEGKVGKQTLDVALSERQFDRIYLCIGINEMGTGDVDYFINAYSAAIDHIKSLQPEAKIYIQSIIAVTKARSDKGDYINNEGIYERNKRLEELADGETCFYLNINSVLCDENGAMIADYTSDGVHLKAQYLALWKDYLLTHVADSKEKE